MKRCRLIDTRSHGYQSTKVPYGIQSYLFFLGHQRHLAAAECLTVLRRYGLAPRMIAYQPPWLKVAVARAVPQGLLDTIGGTDRIARLITERQGGFTVAQLLTHLTPLPRVGLAKWGLPRSLVIGISTVGADLGAVKKIVLTLKRELKARGTRLQFVLPRHGSRLNAAQVRAYHLTRSPNREWTFVAAGDRHLLVETTAVQDVARYAERDIGRPVRFVSEGLLPPKLAQMMINLAVGSDALTAHRLFDPFCGVGTVLQEAYLMGLAAAGSDIDPKMVKGAQANLEWVGRLKGRTMMLPRVYLHDARQPPPLSEQGRYSVVVTEPYLGPTRRQPRGSALAAHIQNLGHLYRDSLNNIRLLLRPDGRVLFTLPYFRLKNNGGDHFFPDSFLDAVERRGYRRLTLGSDGLSLRPASQRGTLLYTRPNARVGRELILWQKE